MSFSESGTLAQNGAWDNASGGNYREDLRPAAGSGYVACFRITGLTTPNTALRYSAASITQGVQTFTATLPARLNLYALFEAAPDQWSDSKIPGFFLTSGAVAVPSIRNQVRQNSAVLLEEKLFTSAPSSITWSPNVSLLNAINALQDWNGVLQFQINAQMEADFVEFDAETDDSPFALSLTVDSRNTTGLSTHRRPTSRTDLCPICGFTGIREDWVRDPEREILVCSRCADERNDPQPTTQGERPPTHED